MNKMGEYVLKDGFLDLAMNEYIINHRKQYQKEYEVITNFNEYIFKIINMLLSNGSNKQNMFIIASVVEMHKFYQSVVLLLERGLPESANSLIRSMIDLLIKLIEVIRVPKAVDILLLNADYETKNILNYLYQNELFDMVPKEELEELIGENEKKIKVGKNPRIKTKELAEKNNVIKMYTLFRFQSDYTHLSTNIIGRVIKTNDKGYYIDESLTINNFKMDIGLAISIISIMIEFILNEYMKNELLVNEYKKLEENFENVFRDLLK